MNRQISWIKENLYISTHLLKFLFRTRTYSGLRAFLGFECFYAMLTTFLFLCLIEYFLISEVFFQLSRLLNSWLCRQLCLEGKVLVAEKSFTEDTAVTLHQLQWKCKEFLASCQRMVLWLHTKSYMLRKDRKLHFYLCFFLWDQTLLKVLRWYSRFQAWQFTIREHRPCSLCSVLCLVPCTVSTVAILHFLTECSSTFSCPK